MISDVKATVVIKLDKEDGTTSYTNVNQISVEIKHIVDGEEEISLYTPGTNATIVNAVEDTTDGSITIANVPVYQSTNSIVVKYYNSTDFENATKVSLVGTTSIYTNFVRV